MLQRLKLTSIQWLNGPRARIIIIFGSLLLAALAGGAPHEGGGS